MTATVCGRFLQIGLFWGLFLGLWGQEPYSLVWQVNFDTGYEVDWTHEILSEVPCEDIVDRKYEVFLDHSIVVVDGTQPNLYVPYFAEMKRRGYKFGVVVHSDEGISAPTEFYEDAEFVLRNYWRPGFAENVKVIPLGYAQGTGQEDRLVPHLRDRPYVWSFVGDPHKTTRKLMLEAMKRVKRGYVHTIGCWQAPESLSRSDYREVLCKSIFVPAPRGFLNAESFRIYEALEAGCIPIVEGFPFDYYKELLGLHPFPTVRFWNQAPEIVERLLNNPQELEALWQQCYHWWRDYKRRLQRELAEFITGIKQEPTPIGFSIPECKIVEEIPQKDRDFAHIIPGKLDTYIYTEEEPYYRDYQRSYFAVTCCKGGWDCMRHYEILANGCIPYFTDLEECPEKCLALFPKELVKEAMALEGVSYLHIDHTKFDEAKYREILEKLLAYTRSVLSTRAMGKYLLEKIGYQGGKVLFLSGDRSTDYLRCLTLIGLKEVLGAQCIDYPKIPHIYTDYAGDVRKLYGKGMSYTKVIADTEVNREEIKQRIREGEFAWIIYGSVHREPPFWEWVHRYTPQERIVYLCGEEGVGKQQRHVCEYHRRPNLFLREW